MNSTHAAPQSGTRRSFLVSGGGVVTSAWLASQWPQIAAAAEHAAHAGQMDAMSAMNAAPPQAAGFAFLSATEAADVDAIAAQIVPSGATPGAREAHAVQFIDRAMSSFFAGWSKDYRSGLAEFQSSHAAAFPAAGWFAQAGAEGQLAFLQQQDRTPFFETTRLLTLLGMCASPRYGGNYQGVGWKLLGFEDLHVFTPPFGYYDREYTGFVPYSSAAAS
jgi:gluconate 2-dehydrogenase gamma chain